MFVRASLAAILAALALAAPVFTERLPLRIYTTADGLAGDRVKRVYRDSRGFLWFCATGLSRFDGQRFTNYGTEDGLPHISINDILESREGEYWVATNGGGIARLELEPPRDGAPRPSRRFAAHAVGETTATNRVNVLFQDRAGTIWVGTDGGLFRLQSGPDAHSFTIDALPLNLAEAPDALLKVWSFLDDGTGGLWIGTSRGLLRRRRDGHVERQQITGGGRGEDVWALLRDRGGRVWAGHHSGLTRLASEHSPIAAGRSRAGYELHELPRPGVRALRELANGHLILGTDAGVLEFDGARFVPFAATALAQHTALSFEEDLEGNLWIATYTSGAMRLARHGFVSYDASDGLAAGATAFVGRTVGGAIYASGVGLFVSGFDGRRFHAVRPSLPPDVIGRQVGRAVLQDSTGDWWVPTADGLFRFGAAARAEDLPHARLIARYSVRDGLPSDDVRRLFADGGGNVWIALRAGGGVWLARWDRRRNAIVRFTETDGLPPLNEPRSFTEDRSGGVWIGFYEGGLARYRDGRFAYYTSAHGVPAGVIADLVVDRSGRLWVGSSQDGLARVDRPDADRPTFVIQTTAHVSAIIEDAAGRIYIGTTTGIDRLDIATGAVTHYGAGEGLANTSVYSARRDKDGALWFGTGAGVSRLVPEAERPSRPPPVFISGLQIAGAPYALPELGQTHLSGVRLGPDQNRLQIEFGGLAFEAGDHLRYQYRLADAESAWSAPTEQRSVTYARLAPGAYTFSVRAVNARGAASATPAVVSFVILAPVWQRWWFVALVAMAAGTVVHAAYRARERRLLELERVRTRIASDLHDDIGASLSRMAILAEVAKLQTRGSPAERMLTDVGESARDLVSSMSDIVWSVDPRRDDLASLLQRVREFASNVLDAKGITWRFDVPDHPERTKLAPEQRRHVFLVLKEAINNSVRHAECATVHLEIRIEDGTLVAEVGDDGMGFDASTTGAVTPVPAGRTGYGLRSMRARASQVGGTLIVRSTPGQGTRVRLSVPVRGGMA